VGTLKYGKKIISFRLPEAWRTVTLNYRKPEPLRLEEALFDALDNPIGEKPLWEWLSKNKDVLIIVPDITRYAGMERILPLLLERLPKDINARIIFALGNHRKQTEEERKEILSDSVYESIPNFDHDCFDAHALTSIGRTRSGLEVVVNSSLIRAKAAIVTGSINFHYLAGLVEAERPYSPA